MTQFARLHVMKNPAYRRYLIACSFEALAFWSQFILVAYVLIRDGGSAVHLGVAAAIAGVPALILTFYGGALSDRIPRRIIVVCAEIILAANATTLALLEVTGNLSFGLIYVSVAVAAITSGFALPSLLAIVRDIVSADELPAAIAIDSIRRNATKVLGPMLGGIIVGLAGADWAFAANGVAFASFAVVVAGLPSNQERAAGRSGRVLGDLREAVVAARTDARIGVLLVLVIGVGLLGFNEGVMCPLLADQVLGGGPGAFGLTVSAAGLGAIIGGLIALGLRTVTMRRVLVGAIGLSASLALLGVVGEARWLTLPLILMWGAFGTIMLTGTSSLIQAYTPPSLEGRMMSFYAFGIAGTTPLGSIILTSIVAASDIEMGVLLFGLAALVFIGVMVHVARRAQVLGSPSP